MLFQQNSISLFSGGIVIFRKDVEIVWPEKCSEKSHFAEIFHTLKISCFLSSHCELDSIQLLYIIFKKKLPHNNKWF